MGFVHMVNVKEHECEELSICCGAERNEYVEDFCGRCNEFSGFECNECEVNNV